MAFATYEISRKTGRPVSLFLFTHGDGATSYYAYTTAEQVVNFDGFDYQPIAMQRGSITSSGNLDKSTLNLRLQRDLPIFELFRVYPPSTIMSLVIREGHENDPEADFLVVWSGRVLSVGREGNECVMACEPISSSLRRPGLRRNYQYGCPHALYLQGSGLCNANEAAATTSGEVAEISGLSITLLPGWNAAGVAKYAGGKVKWTTPDGDIEVRTILQVSGDTLLLGGLIRGLGASDIIEIVLGCEHNQSDCLNLHNNIQNYGGCDWIPTQNPIGTYNNYY